MDTVQAFKDIQTSQPKKIDCTFLGKDYRLHHLFEDYGVYEDRGVTVVYDLGSELRAFLSKEDITKAYYEGETLHIFIQWTSTR